jgi:hypothetical protein
MSKITQPYGTRLFCRSCKITKNTYCGRDKRSLANHRRMTPMRRTHLLPWSPDFSPIRSLKRKTRNYTSAQRRLRLWQLSFSKSNHTILGHLRGKLCDHCRCTLSGSKRGNRRGHLRRVVEFGQRIGPGPIDAQMLFHVPDQMPHPLTGMVACTFIVDIAKGPLNGIGIRAVGRQVEQRKAGMGS